MVSCSEGPAVPLAWVVGIPAVLPAGSVAEVLPAVACCPYRTPPKFASNCRVSDVIRPLGHELGVWSCQMMAAAAIGARGTGAMRASRSHTRPSSMASCGADGCDGACPVSACSCRQRGETVVEGLLTHRVLRKRAHYLGMGLLVADPRQQPAEPSSQRSQSSQFIWGNRASVKCP